MVSPEQLLASLRTRYSQWETAWQQRHAEVEEVLFHYTNGTALLGIVQDRQIWASKAAFLNDSTELVYMGRVLADVAQELRTKYEVKGDIRDYAADAYGHTGRFSRAQQLTASVISILEDAPTFSQGLFDVYVSCFCSDGDLLSQWRGYPSAGGGYALGLRAARLAGGGGLLRHVIYCPETQRQILHDLLSPIIEAVASEDWQAVDEGTDPWQLLVREHLGAVSASLLECGFCFKHPGFMEESEWRVVILRPRDPRYRPDDPPPLLRATPTGLVPYLARSLEEDAIAKIVVGPGSEPTLAADAAAQLLTNAGYEDAGSMVAHSEIPLRA